MKSVYQDSLLAVLGATEVQPGFRYLWFGREYGGLPRSVRRVLDDASARHYLLVTLQAHLYSLFHCAGEATPASRSFQRRPARPLGAELARANGGRGYYSHGWQVRSFHPDALACDVTKGHLTLRVSVEDCLTPGGRLPAPEALVGVRFQKDLPKFSPGFYMALGGKELTRDEPSAILRLYWNLTPAGAVRFMEATTSALNRAGLPFTLKALDDATRYTRCDAVVLYIRKDDFRSAATILERISRAVDAHLHAATPAFTKRLRPGVGIAESPASGESFGLSRCRALADGILRAHETARTSLRDRLHSVEESFIKDGFDFDLPYLNLGSRDHYGFRPRRRPAPSTESESGVPTDGEVLQAADEIGRTLAREAIWHDTRCSWIGAELVPETPGEISRLKTVYQSSGPDLYGGTSGIALFLAELALLTEDRLVRQTALGAIGHALTRAGDVPARKRFGFYSGVLGIACAASRIGTILGEEGLLARAARVLSLLGPTGGTRAEFDLISGKAGAIVGLLRLRHELRDVAHVRVARQLGDALLRSARYSAIGCSWSSGTHRRRHNLTGFSHGTAGVAYALLELGYETKDDRYSRAAEEALRYERHFFDPDAGNWPDLRDEPSRPNRHSPRSFKTLWCHGAPGAALARLRAYQITGSETFRQEAEIALRTTRAAVIASMESRRMDYSLCHGLPGNTDVLISGYQVLGSPWITDIDLGRRVARAITKSRGWAEVENPGLMLGQAGAGYFLLRLCNANTPSVLLPPASNALSHP